MLLKIVSGLTTLSVFALAAFIAAAMYAFNKGLDPTLINDWIILPGVCDFFVLLMFYVSEEEMQKTQVQKKEEARLERLRRFRGQ